MASVTFTAIFTLACLFQCSAAAALAPTPALAPAPLQKQDPLRNVFRTGNATTTSGSNAAAGSSCNMRFSLLPLKDAGDMALALSRADRSPAQGALFVDRWVSAEGRASVRTLTLLSSVALSKPLVLGAGVSVFLGPGVVLSLLVQPVLPTRPIFEGPGSVRFVAPQPREFWALPEWWGGGGRSDSDMLEAAAAACAGPGVRCLLPLTGSYRLDRAWKMGPHIVPWTAPAATMSCSKGGSGEGVVFTSGVYGPRRRLDLPRLFAFHKWAVKVEDVDGLTLYLHNVKYAGTGVLLAPRAAIRRTRVELPVLASSAGAFAVEAAAPGALLEDVYMRNYMYVKNVPGQVALTHFRGPWAPRLANVTFENSEVVGGPSNRKTAFFFLKNDSLQSVRGLVYRAPTWNGQMPPGWQAVAGRFDGLDATIRLTKDFYGGMSWAGSNNTLNWWGLSRLQPRAADWARHTLLTAPRVDTPPHTHNSLALALPPLRQPWPAGATRTFYAYHVMADGSSDPGTVSLGPHNHAKLPRHLRPTNPGIVVEAVEDQGGTAQYQLAIILRNLAGRTLTAVDFQDERGRDWKVPLQFRLVVGVRQLR